MARKGRGRLSSIDLLPEEAEPIVAWAFQELKERNRTQTEIHAEFNEKLAELGLGPISRSAFGRHSIAVAQMARRHEEVRQITRTLTDRLDPGETDDLTIMAAETVKMLVFELMRDDEGITPKGAMELARALQAAVNAQQKPIARKREQLKAFEKNVDAALDQVAAETGLSEERLVFVKRKMLGLRV